MGTVTGTYNSNSVPLVGLRPDNTFRPQVETYWQDQHTETVDLHLCRYFGDITLAANTTIDDTIVSLAAGHGVIVGNIICFKENKRHYQGVAITVNTNDITLDTPLDYAYTTSAISFRSSENIAVDGSSGTIMFQVSPPAGAQWDITRCLLSMRDATAMDDGKFGGITSLTNGIVFRVKNGITKNIFNIKNNGDFASHAYDVTYVDSTLGPGGEYGLRVRRSFNGNDKNGVVLRLDGDSGDTFQLLVRDNLTGLTYFTCVVQGHVVD